MDQSKTIVCRCEEVTLGELVAVANAYQCSSRELKLRTRAGMGYCGGRTCRALVDTIAHQSSGQTPSHSVPLGYQPPVRPIPFDLLGGNR
ncbi:(2Fe-2S)-binding protein [Brevibacillus fluminis]|uniref:(2Fe-2S)-binding protein n=1 Tax=Brevibacillus fluminis TaxID=511487 RepID=UPI003F8C61B4